MLKHELTFLCRIKDLVRDLNKMPDFTTHGAFKTIDRYNEGSINMRNLQDFFRNFGNYLIDTEIYAIVRRIDCDGDAKISYDDFRDFFNPRGVSASCLLDPMQASA